MLREHRGFSDRSGARAPSERRPPLCGCLLPVRSLRLLLSRFWVRRRAPALPISRERGGLVHRRCAGHGCLFGTSLRLTTYPRRLRRILKPKARLSLKFGYAALKLLLLLTQQN